MTFRRTSMESLPPARRRCCSKCGRLGHLSTTCRGTDKAYDRVGIEIEGYWDQATWAATVARADNWHMGGCRDGSLGSHDEYVSWEFQTRPGSLGEAINQLTALYPHATDNDCGMHVHTSFLDRADVMALYSPEFFEYFHDAWTAWGTEMQLDPGGQFWKRLKGQNTYCRPNSRGRLNHVNDVRRQDGRYWQLNFTAYSEHGTVECRLLPMFRDARIGIAAVEKLTDIYETFLNSCVDERVYRAASRRVSRVFSGVKHTDAIVSTFEMPSTGIEPTIITRDVEAPEVPTPAPGHVVIPRTRLSHHLQQIGAI